ncbi:MAG: FxLYD domain-containing protein, partial [Candidatus Eremiobacteraeota bacterium]|nr:FxLYD domain-containing protein [Candidatus Eremiobacteraeota bacterium]
SASPAFAWDLFVEGRPFEAPVEVVEGTLEAPLAELLEAFGCGWTKQGDQVMIVAHGKADGTIGPRDKLYFEGVRMRLARDYRGRRTWVPVLELANTLGSRYEVSKELRAVDLWPPTLTPKPSRLMQVGDGKRAGEPLHLDDVSFAVEPHEGKEQMHGYAVITNTSARTQKDVVVWVRVIDEAGKVLGQFGRGFATLEPGQQVSYQFPTFEAEAGASLKPSVELRWSR